MNRLSKILSVVSASVLSVSLLTGVAGLAAVPPAERDPDGDGELLLNDVIYTKWCLSGKYKPTSLGKLDFDGNGVVSDADADKLQRYLIHAYDNVFTYNTEPETPDVPSVDSYMKHDCSSSPSSYSIYQLTTETDNNSDNIDVLNLYSMDNNDFQLSSDRAVVQLAISDGTVGTGFIISDNVVVTSAHCVYNSYNETFKNVTVNIRNSSGKKKASYQPKSIHVPLEYGNATDGGRSDFALIYLEDVEKNENGVVDGKGLTRYGKFNLGLSMNSLPSQNAKVKVCGFPKSNIPAGYSYGVRFESEGFLDYYDGDNNNRMVYDITTDNGMSGAPVYITETFKDKNGDEYTYNTVIGVNYKNEYSPNNYGYRFTPETLTFFLQNTYLID